MQFIELKLMILFNVVYIKSGQNKTIQNIDQVLYLFFVSEIDVPSNSKQNHSAFLAA